MSDAATLIDPGTPAPAAVTPPAAVAVDPAANAVPSPALADPASPGAAVSAPDADWRKVLAGDDTDALKALERYATPGDYHKSFTEAQKTIRAKQEGMVKLLGENATDEDKAAFQKALGIPPAPDKYERIAPPEGLELADADKAFIDKSIQKLHGMGGFAAHPEVVKTLQSFYHEAMQEQAAVMAAAAVQKKNEGKATLTKLYGQNLDLELKHAQNALVAFGPRDPQKARALLDRQFADGTTLGDDPEIVQMLVRASRATHEDPMMLATLSGGLPSDAGSVQQQIDDIMKTKGTPAYDAKADQLRALLAQRQRISG
jgi:hypothetical protein